MGRFEEGLVHGTSENNALTRHPHPVSLLPALAQDQASPRFVAFRIPRSMIHNSPRVTRNGILLISRGTATICSWATAAQLTRKCSIVLLVSRCSWTVTACRLEKRRVGV